jgi:hypothetical protein
MYDGERYTIDGYEAERAETIIETLDLHSYKHTGSPHYVSKDWLVLSCGFGASTVLTGGRMPRPVIRCWRNCALGLMIIRDCQ